MNNLLFYLLLAEFCLLSLCQTTVSVEQQCENMEGECSSCVCCCYRSGLDLMRYRPNDDCECASELAPGFIVAMVLLGMSLVTSLLGGCYFAGKLPISPFQEDAALPLRNVAAQIQ